MDSLTHLGSQLKASVDSWNMIEQLSEQTLRKKPAFPADDAGLELPENEEGRGGFDTDAINLFLWAAEVSLGSFPVRQEVENYAHLPVLPS